MLAKTFLNVLIFALPKTMFKVYKSLITHHDRGTTIGIGVELSRDWRTGCTTSA